MIRRTSLILAVSSFVAVAGCSGGSDTSEASAGDLGSASPETGSGFEGSGAIVGHVVDDQSLPIEGAQVAIVRLNLLAVTGADGAFSFRDLAAGSYAVAAQRLGYDSTLRNALVEEGQETELLVALVPITIEQTFHETIGPYSGFVTCAFVQPGISGVIGSTTYNCNNGVFEDVMGEQHNVLEFELRQENVWSVIGEMRWEPATTATSREFALFFTHDDGYGSDWWCNAGGPSPVQFVYNIEEEKVLCDGQGSGTDGPPETDQTLHLTAFLPFSTIYPTNPTASTLPNVAFQQHYESIAEVFYGEDPVLPFTAFPDA